MSDSPDIMAEGKFVRLVNDHGWEYAERVNSTGVVVILPIRNDETIILTEQYRPPVKGRVIDLCAGLVGDQPGEEDEEFQLAAGRELLEETGYQARTISFLFDGPPSAGMTSEIVHFYIASELEKIHDGGGVDGEDILVHEIPLDEIDQWLQMKDREGFLIDPKIYVGLYFLMKQKEQ